MMNGRLYTSAITSSFVIHTSYSPFLCVSAAPRFKDIMRFRPPIMLNEKSDLFGATPELRLGLDGRLRWLQVRRAPVLRPWLP